MKIGIFSPYLDTLGGGERYLMTIASCLSSKYQVEVFWDEPGVREQLTRGLNINLTKVRFRENIFSQDNNLFKRWQVTKKLDAFFYLSDGSLPFLFAKNNIIHFQVPFQNVEGRSFINQLKLKTVSQVICNSLFTKRYIDKEFGIKSRVIYPPASVEEFKPIRKKENFILSVGRFTQALHSKKQEVLIEVFKKMIDSGLFGWQLILVGNALPGENNYLDDLKASIGNYPIKIFTDMQFNKLKEYYKKAKIFWHATGFGENENIHPERMEHFGIVIVEAMAAGCVPVVIGKGGIPEIVDDGKNGFLWQDIKDLKKLTLQLIKSPKKLTELSKQAIIDCQKFNEKNFCKKIYELVEH